MIAPKTRTYNRNCAFIFSLLAKSSNEADTAFSIKLTISFVFSPPKGATAGSFASEAEAGDILDANQLFTAAGGRPSPIALEGKARSGRPACRLPAGGLAPASVIFT
eukprot:scaffold22069_cov35-Prasinocladus_malaysianus.AAC.1